MNTPLEIDVEKVERELETLASKHRQAWRVWTDAETKLLLRFYRRVPLKVLAEKLDRNTTALASRVDALRKQGHRPECDK